jgi:hypothetical protein
MSNWLPLSFVGLGIVSLIVTEWLRHRSWLKHRASGFAPSTQHIAVIGTFVAGAVF